MGCASSKEGEDAPGTNHEDVKVAEKDAASGAKAAEKHEEHRQTHTGFHSDVESTKKHAFTEQLVTNNVHQIEEIYDLTHSTTLGRGACGCSVV